MSQEFRTSTFSLPEKCNEDNPDLFQSLPSSRLIVPITMLDAGISPEAIQRQPTVSFTSHLHTYHDQPPRSTNKTNEAKNMSDPQPRKVVPTGEQVSIRGVIFHMQQLEPISDSPPPPTGTPPSPSCVSETFRRSAKCSSRQAARENGPFIQNESAKHPNHCRFVRGPAR